MDGHTYPIFPPFDVKAPEFIITNLNDTKNKNQQKI